MTLWAAFWGIGSLIAMGQFWPVMLSLWEPDFKTVAAEAFIAMQLVCGVNMWRELRKAEGQK